MSSWGGFGSLRRRRIDLERGDSGGALGAWTSSTIAALDAAAGPLDDDVIEPLQQQTHAAIRVIALSAGATAS